jgi:hypothetical protein
MLKERKNEMPTTVTLKVKDDQGNVIKRQHEIEDIDLLQFEKMMEVIKETIKVLRSDESLTDLVGDFLGGKKEQAVEGEDEELEFVMQILNSFDTLAIKAPKQAFKLLSVLSGIELPLLQQQKFFDVLDIYDAILEENDIERLVTRIKKSLSVTLAKAKFLGIARKATR